MMETRDMGEMRKLAKGNPLRERVVEERKTRCGSRSRRLECRLCLESNYSPRDKTDICEECVLSIWRAEDVSKQLESTGAGQGMRVINFPSGNRSHDLPYPHLRSNLKVPEGAVFERNRNSGSTNGSRVMQDLFQEILAGLGEAYPADPAHKRSSEPFLARGDLHAVLPRKTVGALMDLWHFIIWLSEVSAEEAFEQGSSLIQGLALGTHTMEQFNNAVAKQTAAMQRGREKAEKGELSQ